jgi:hypothetical protein
LTTITSLAFRGDNDFSSRGRGKLRQQCERDDQNSQYRDSHAEQEKNKEYDPLRARCRTQRVGPFFEPDFRPWVSLWIKTLPSQEPQQYQ